MHGISDPPAESEVGMCLSVTDLASAAPRDDESDPVEILAAPNRVRVESGLDSMPDDVFIRVDGPNGAVDIWMTPRTARELGLALVRHADRLLDPSDL
jgi:hypothetical protein